MPLTLLRLTAAHQIAIIERLKESRAPRFVILNKIDVVPRENLLALTSELNALLPFERTFMVSALKNDGVGDVLSTLSALLPAGPFLYPEDQAADLPLRLLAAEVTREQVFLQLHQELPYATASARSSSARGGPASSRSAPAPGTNSPRCWSGRCISSCTSR